MIPQDENDYIMRGVMLEHVGHDLRMVTYDRSGTEVWNVALECDTCDAVLIDYETDWYMENIGEQ